MKSIRASKVLAVIDDVDFKSVSQFNWCSKDRSDLKGKYVYRYIRVGSRKYSRQLLHHFLMNPPSGMTVDHRDGNGLNNQRENLRLATQQQNSFNQKKQSTGTISKHKGVTKQGLIHGKYVPTKPWRARIRHNDKLIGLGFYRTQAEAALAYNQKASELFGEFANLNVLAMECIK